MRKIIVLLFSALMLFSLSACTGKPQRGDNTGTPAISSTAATTVASSELTAQGKADAGQQEHPRVQITMQNGDKFVIELYPEYAPKTVANFLSLVEDGFYDGLTFHRVVEYFAQGGDPEGTGFGLSKGSVDGEFALNGYPQNTLSHQRGVVSMARTNNYNSAYSQFFICYCDCSFLDGQYAAFGKVVEGMETVDDFLKIKRVYGSDDDISSPVEKIVMKKAEVLGDK